MRNLEISKHIHFYPVFFLWNYPSTIFLGNVILLTALTLLLLTEDNNLDICYVPCLPKDMTNSALNRRNQSLAQGGGKHLPSKKWRQMCVCLHFFDGRCGFNDALGYRDKIVYFNIQELVWSKKNRVCWVKKCLLDIW